MFSSVFWRVADSFHTPTGFILHNSKETTLKQQMKGWSHPGAPRLRKCKEQRRILLLMNSSFLFIWLTESETWPTLVHKYSYKCKRRLSSLCRGDEKKTKKNHLIMLGWNQDGVCLPWSSHTEAQVWVCFWVNWDNRPALTPAPLGLAPFPICDTN